MKLARGNAARGFLLVVTTVLLGAAPGSNTRSIPNHQPDTEEREFYSPFDEDTGLELPLERQNSSQAPRFDEGTRFDATQGQVDQAHGFYSHGTLANASVFALEGEGFVKIFRPRDRGYATYDLTAVVETAAARLHHDYPGGERIQIGDVCARYGGKLSRHASHQNGLDADIAYLRVNHREQSPDDPAVNGFDELFVKNGKISANFDEQRVWEFVKALHGTGRVLRIFMDPVIKGALCGYSAKIGETDQYADVLRHIRPLANHKDHMHVRITCPAKSPDCQKQADPPAGAGCTALELSSPDSADSID